MGKGSSKGYKRHLKRLNTDLSASSDGKIKFDKKIIMAIFLEGLSKEFETTVNSLLAGRVCDRGIVLSRLLTRRLVANLQEMSSN